MTKLGKKVDNVKLSHVSVSVFEHYYTKEIEPLTKLLKRKFDRLQNLPKDSKEKKYLEQEVKTIYQAIVAMDGMKEIYSDHYAQLWAENQKLQFGYNCVLNDLETARKLATQAIEGEAMYLGLLTKKTA